SRRAKESRATIIRYRGVVKRYGPFEALSGVDLDVHAGEVVCLIGPSGSGKPTLLRCTIALEAMDGGATKFEGGRTPRDGGARRGWGGGGRRAGGARGPAEEGEGVPDLRALSPSRRAPQCRRRSQTGPGGAARRGRRSRPGDARQGRPPGQGDELSRRAVRR